jgi:hypothetical protein
MEQRISGWLAKVPGYTGYRSKEDRRDEDKRVREATAANLNAIADRLTQAGAELVAKRQLDRISAVESTLADTRHLADRIRNASYGYGGIFTEHSIDDLALDQLRQFDVALQREIANLETAANSITTDQGLQAYRDELGRLTTLFNSRSGVVDTGKPSADEQALALLDQPAKSTPSPLLDVNVGDALSVLGDNFTADATIDLQYRDLRIKLIRISGDKQQGERWLLGSSSTESFPSADLIEANTETAVATTGTFSSLPATASLSGPQGTNNNVPASFSYENDDANISMELNVGGGVRSFQGKLLKDIDVEIYGPTGR